MDPYTWETLSLTWTPAWVVGRVGRRSPRVTTRSLSSSPTPFRSRCRTLILGLDFAFDRSAKIGGLASGARQQGQNALFLNDEVYRDGAVGVGLHGNIVVDTVVAQGCRPIGSPMRITGSQRNVLQGLDGKRPHGRAAGVVPAAERARPRVDAQLAVPRAW